MRVWTPALNALIERTDAACLRRDQLITRTLALELPRIQIEIPYKNSPEARRYIEAHLRTLYASGGGATQYSLALDSAVAAQLEQVCAEKNIPREALLNRLLMLLGAPGDFLNKHFFMTPLPPSTSDSAWTFDKDGVVDVRALAAGMIKFDKASADFDLTFAPLGRIVSVVSDPLRRYRELLQVLYAQLLNQCTPDHQQTRLLREGEYCFTPFGMPLEDEKLIGLNCYLPDMAISDSQNSDLILTNSSRASSKRLESVDSAKTLRSKK